MSKEKSYEFVFESSLGSIRCVVDSCKLNPKEWYLDLPDAIKKAILSPPNKGCRMKRIRLGGNND